MNTAETQYEGISIPQGFAPTKVEGEDTIVRLKILVVKVVNYKKFA